MRSLGFDVKKAEVLQLMETYDLALTCSISYNEFVEIMTDKISARDPEEELSKAFELFDEVRQSGFVAAGTAEAACDTWSQEHGGSAPFSHGASLTRVRPARTRRGASRCGICAASPRS